MSLIGLWLRKALILAFIAVSIVAEALRILTHRIKAWTHAVFKRKGCSCHSHGLVQPDPIDYYRGHPLHRTPSSRYSNHQEIRTIF